MTNTTTPSKKTMQQALENAVKEMHYKATETLFWCLDDEKALEGYDADEGLDADGNDAYENCEVKITITHKGKTFSN